MRKVEPLSRSQHWRLADAGPVSWTGLVVSYLDFGSTLIAVASV
jgi:hypothetical protein